jgi:hypothetical protein
MRVTVGATSKPRQLRNGFHVLAREAGVAQTWRTLPGSASARVVPRGRAWALLSFMGGAVIVRRSAYLKVGGYDQESFMGGERRRCRPNWPEPTGPGGTCRMW